MMVRSFSEIMLLSLSRHNMKFDIYTDSQIELLEGGVHKHSKDFMWSHQAAMPVQPSWGPECIELTAFKQMCQRKLAMIIIILELALLSKMF